MYYFFAFICELFNCCYKKIVCNIFNNNVYIQGRKEQHIIYKLYDCKTKLVVCRGI